LDKSSTHEFAFSITRSTDRAAGDLVYRGLSVIHYRRQSKGQHHSAAAPSALASRIVSPARDARLKRVLDHSP
jgi:hypothetical protein